MKKSSFFKQIVLVVMILAFASAAFAVAFAIEFKTPEVVESGDYVGYAKDAVCGPDGKIHLSYMNNSGHNDSTSGEVKYAVYDGDTWAIETVIAPDDYLASDTSIALDSSGYPHIIYNYTCEAIEHTQNLDHSWWNGTTWQTENVFDGELAKYRPGHPTLAISGGNVMNVVFHVKQDMYWAKKQLPSGSWDIQEIQGVTGSHTSMVLDSRGYPNVSYKTKCEEDEDISALGYSFYDGSAWVHEEIVSGDVRGTSIALDPNGVPCISFVDKDTSSLYFARKDGSDWDVEFVDQDGIIVWEFTSLGFASDGTPFIAYMDGDVKPGTVKVAKKDSDTGWTVSEVDNEAGDWEYCQFENVSLVVDKKNYVHVFYNGSNDFDEIDADIKHAVSLESQAPYDDGGGSSGCNAGMAPLALMLLTPLFFFKRKK